MRTFVPECFKHPGKGWQTPQTYRERRRKLARLAQVANDAQPGNSQYIIFPQRKSAPTTADSLVVNPSSTIGPTSGPLMGCPSAFRQAPDRDSTRVATTTGKIELENPPRRESRNHAGQL